MSKNKKNQNKRNPKKGVAAEKGMGLYEKFKPYYGVMLNPKVSFQPRFVPTRMRYCDEFLISHVGGLVNDQIFRMNSVFDPDRTNVGHQPLGFDQLTPLYDHYRVNSFSWHVNASSSSAGYNISCAPVNGAQVITVLGALGEYGPAITKAQGNGSPSAIFNGNALLSTFQGRSQMSYHSDDLTAATVATNPNEVLDFHIVTHNPNAGTIIINYVVTLDYEVIFFDMSTPGQS